MKSRNKHHVLSIMRNRRDAGARRAEGESGTEMGRAGRMKTERERGAGGRRERGLGSADERMVKGREGEGRAALYARMR